MGLGNCPEALSQTCIAMTEYDSVGFIEPRDCPYYKKEIEHTGELFVRETYTCSNPQFMSGDEISVGHIVLRRVIG